jgi:hypothetical protein
MAAGSKRNRGLKKGKLARDYHARVPLGIPMALFPMPRRFNPVRSLPEARFALYKGHLARNHLWKSLGRSGDRRFRPDGQRPARNPKNRSGDRRIEPESFSQETLDVR